MESNLHDSHVRSWLAFRSLKRLLLRLSKEIKAGRVL
jgi:hypothetical protein